MKLKTDEIPDGYVEETLLQTWKKGESTRKAKLPKAKLPKT